MSTQSTPPNQDFQAMIKEIIANFFADIGLGELPQEQKEKHFEEILGIIQDRVFLHILEELSEEEKASFEQCTSEDQIRDFFKEHDIDIVAITIEEAQNYREELLQNTAYIQAKLDPTDIPPQA